MRNDIQRIGKTAVYCRTASANAYAIENQARLLTKYAAEHGLVAPEIYADDGASGLTLKRPALSRLLADIEAGKIGTVLIKNYDRLSRNLADVYLLTDGVFSEYGIRLIAADNDRDSADGNGGIVSFADNFMKKPPTAYAS
jgi:DNA invertase Pin-like site-specific DNA recombinase